VPYRFDSYEQKWIRHSKKRVFDILCSEPECYRTSKRRHLCDMHAIRSKPIDVKRKWSREWVARRKKEWFSDKSCEVCGSSNSLELWGRGRTSPPWSFSAERRNAILSKMRIRCKACRYSIEYAKVRTPEAVIARAIELMKQGKPFNHIIREVRIDKKALRPLAEKHGIEVASPQREKTLAAAIRDVERLIERAERLSNGDSNTSPTL
jgi:hypothetical protein